MQQQLTLPLFLFLDQKGWTLFIPLQIGLNNFAAKSNARWVIGPMHFESLESGRDFVGLAR